MNRTDAATEYRRIRAAYIARQNAGCTIYGTRATVDSFNKDARFYVANVLDVRPTPGAFVDAARGMVAHLKANGVQL